MLITIDTETCFECGAKATEQHHIIPQVYGGTKTIPLCSSCHMKVHGIKSEKRIDNHTENTKRGLDKNRIWELFSGWIVIQKHNPINKTDFKNYYVSIFDSLFSTSKVYRIYERINELEKDFLFSLFKEKLNEPALIFFLDNNEFEVVDYKIIKLIIKNIRQKVKKLGNPKNLSNESRKKGVQERRKNALTNETNIRNSKFVYENKINGLNYSEITKKMNELGYTTRQGKPMNQVQVKRLYEKYIEILKE